MSDLRKLLGLDKVTIDHAYPTAARPAADLTDAKLAEFAEARRK